MIKQFRWKFIRVAMISITLVVVIIIGAANLLHFISMNQQAEAKLDIIEAGKGVLPSGVNSITGWQGGKLYWQTDKDDESLYEIRYFTVTLDENGQLLSLNLRRTATLRERDAISLATMLWEKQKQTGFVDCYKYRAIQREKEILYVFLNCHRGLSDCKIFLALSAAISLFGLLLVFALVALFSGRAIRPLTESYQKQKRFITDASHELKTPMTIISANTEVMELLYGENEWTQSTRSQIQRLSDLTERLVFLTRMDEEQTALEMAEFSLSDVIAETARPFQNLAATRGLHLETKLQEGISYNGNEASIHQLASLLLDNAVKYARKNTTIQCTLRGKKHPVLSIQNEAEGLTIGKQDMLFERFYRPDTSRSSKTGGHGIGLSTAKAIVTAHRGKISAISPDGKTICFTVQF